MYIELALLFWSPPTDGKSVYLDAKCLLVGNFACLLFGAV